VPEFEAGHPSGAYNVPLLHQTEGGMTPNPDFKTVMEAVFPKDQRLVLGCRSGKRSLKAAEVLAKAGYQQVVDMQGGFLGEVTPTGQVTCAGWMNEGLAVATSPQLGKAYADLGKKA
jgi:rhodanese-related sulfurtransferase